MKFGAESRTEVSIKAGHFIAVAVFWKSSERTIIHPAKNIQLLNLVFSLLGILMCPLPQYQGTKSVNFSYAELRTDAAEKEGKVALSHLFT